MSLAAIIGILLNVFLPGEKEEVATLIENDNRQVRSDKKKKKNDLKEELTVELKEDIIKAIREEMNKPNKKKKK